jgi:hypothetical protein
MMYSSALTFMPLTGNAVSTLRPLFPNFHQKLGKKVDCISEGKMPTELRVADERSIRVAFAQRFGSNATADAADPEDPEATLADPEVTRADAVAWLRLLLAKLRQAAARAAALAPESADTSLQLQRPETDVSGRASAHCSSLALQLVAQQEGSMPALAVLSQYVAPPRRQGFAARGEAAAGQRIARARGAAEGLSGGEHGTPSRRCWRWWDLCCCIDGGGWRPHKRNRRPVARPSAVHQPLCLQVRQHTTQSASRLDEKEDCCTIGATSAFRKDSTSRGHVGIFLCVQSGGKHR